jgi:CobQ/CobB/MinD/ParA nucleotide binding domain
MLDQTHLPSDGQGSTTSSSKAETGTATSTTKTVKFVLMGKGGCGKSIVANFLAQQLVEYGKPVICVDADPVNNTLSGVAALGAEIIDLLEDDAVNIPVMDDFISRILETDSNFIIDAGASGFVPLLSYILRDDLFQLIANSGKRVQAHAVIVGGESMVDTSAALDSMLKQFPTCVSVFCWLNPFFGPLESNGVAFEQTPWWAKRSSLVSGIVRLPVLDRAIMPAWRKMHGGRKTFSEAADSPDFNAVEKLRLGKMWAPIREQIAGLR